MLVCMQNIEPPGFVELVVFDEARPDCPQRACFASEVPSSNARPKHASSSATS